MKPSTIVLRHIEYLMRMGAIVSHGSGPFNIGGKSSTVDSVYSSQKRFSPLTSDPLSLIYRPFYCKARFMEPSRKGYERS
jgi:hypothetical protein